MYNFYLIVSFFFADCILLPQFFFLHTAEKKRGGLFFFCDMNSDNLSISFASSLGITDFAADIPENFNTDQPDKSINLNYKQESYKRKASSPKQTDKDPIQSFLNESKWHNHSQRPLNSRNLMKDPINNRARSPGEHFGKRSMPLDNMSAMWSKETGNRKPSHSKEENVSEANNKKVILKSKKKKALNKTQH